MRYATILLTALATLVITAGISKADDMLGKELQNAHARGELKGLHSVLVILDGEVLGETYFSGDDEEWGRPVSDVKHGPDTLHDLRSVSKSVVGLLYGIALAQGKVPPVDAPLLEQFPQYPELASDPQRAKLEVRHALTMTMATEWNEELPYTDPKNSEIAMEQAEDRYHFVLSRPMVAEPGEKWTYNGGATALTAKLIADGTGMPIDAFAKEVLFDPLGIENFEWVRGADGVPAAASGLRLTLRDLAKIGQLVLDNGVHEGKQIVPAEWLEASFTPRATLDGLRYGYQWWLAGDGEPPRWMAGFGNGGQRLTIQHGINLIVAVYAGNYNQPDAWRIPVRVIEEFVVPAVRAKLGR